MCSQKSAVVLLQKPKVEKVNANEHELQSYQLSEQLGWIARFAAPIEGWRLPARFVFFNCWNMLRAVCVQYNFQAHTKTKGISIHMDSSQETKYK